MKIINARIHGILDFVMVAFLWASPHLFGLSDFVSMITYALGGVHLGLTLFTNYPLGMVRIISLRIHSYVEIVVSIVLVMLPWFPGFSSELVDKIFYVVIGVCVFTTWLLTDYQS